MNSFHDLRHALLPAAVSVLSLAAQAQLQISEVRTGPVGADVGDQTIELFNAGGDAIEMQSFLLCAGGVDPQGHGCLSPLPELVLPAQSYVRVHWGEMGRNDPFDVYTGAGFDPIPHEIGAVILLSSDLGSVVDYVQWGGDCFPVSTAALFGQWIEGTWVETPFPGNSIAYDGGGDARKDWFEDLSPTLGFANTLPGEPSVFFYGSGCAGTLGEPSIGTVFGPPALGNQSFAVRVTNAMPKALAMLAMSPGEAHIQMYGCELQIDFAQPGFALLGYQPVTRGMFASFPVPVPHDTTLIGLDAYLQSGVLDPAAPAGIAFTPGMRVTF